MKLTFASERVLAVMAHPDDAELLCAGTLARARAEGAAVAICVMCAGDKGIPPDAGASDVATVRREEATRAAELLGASLLWFGAPDGELLDTIDHRRRLVQMYLDFRPTLVLAHSNEDYHPDHRAAGVLAEAASWFAASRGHASGSAPPLDRPPALWWCDTINAAAFTPGFYVDISDHLELKRQMLACHQSQIRRAGDGEFPPLAEHMARHAALRGSQSGVAAAEAFRSHHAMGRLRAW